MDVSEEQTEFWSTVVRSRIALHTSIEATGNVRGEALAMARALARLNSHLNTLCPISRLPDEIIALILIFHAELEPHFYPDRDDYSHLSAESNVSPAVRLGWIACTHVCHRWREIALDNPSLWSNVSFCMGRDAATTFLIRSRNRPLLLDVWLEPLYERDSVEWYALDAYTDWVRDIVRSNIHRTHTLRVMERFLVWDYINTTEAPLLHTLWLYSSEDNFDWDRPVLANCAPLKDVWIRNFNNAPLDAISFRGVTCLRIERGDPVVIEEAELDIDGIGYLDDMLASLQLLDSLQSLTVINSISPQIRAADLSDVPICEFKKLSYLFLEGDIRDLARFADRTVWPRKASVDFVCPSLLWFTDNPPLDILNMLRTRFERDARISIAYTLFAGYDMKKCQNYIYLYDAELDLGSPLPPISQPFFRFSSPGSGRPSDIMTLLQIPFSPLVKSLHISVPNSRLAIQAGIVADWPDNHLEWHSILAENFPLVKSIRCTGFGVAEGLIGALYDDIKERARYPGEPQSRPYPPTEDDMLFLGLQRLYFDPVDWDATLNYRLLPAGAEDTEEIWESESAVELLVAVAAAKAKKGFPIELVAANDMSGGNWPKERLQDAFRVHCPNLKCAIIDDGRLKDM